MGQWQDVKEKSQQPSSNLRNIRSVEDKLNCSTTKSQREVYLHAEILGPTEHKHQKNGLVLMFYYLIIFYYT